MLIQQPIGIFGGTFDPIHLGHLHLADEIFKLARLQKILFIPCWCSPLRDQPATSTEDRLKMIKLAISNHKYYEVDDREIARDEISYTIDTIKSLRKEYPHTPLILIMATDAFNRFDEWKDAKQILDFTHLLIANRPKAETITNPYALQLLHQYQTNNIKALEQQKQGLIYLAKISDLDITATTIRALIKENKDASYLVTPKVWEYIQKKHLYKEINH